MNQRTVQGRLPASSSPCERAQTAAAAASNKRPYAADAASEEQRRLAKRPRSAEPSEPQKTTLLSVDEIVFETATNDGHIGQGTFAAFFEPDPQLDVGNGRQLPIAGHAPARFHYSWDKFEDCMRGRLGSEMTNGGNYSCRLLRVPDGAQRLLRYEYHFCGEVGFGNLVQLLAARLVGGPLPFAGGAFDEVAASIRFSASRIEPSGDYLVRVKAVDQLAPRNDATGSTG
ncbi:hypothetical protein FLAG1_10345 [Fusarium langsethiae]|uniref:Uncharacterized protein n=1 Tax=Fusarium langsethiae TaxID=179993 RepID=A0A0M9EPD5_FUSLA|nr:hypothetical protein FLAG1_10345 [Fusarium langsethiae]GKU15225.1 unnamed protein product [Fusarium langsethiae]GKU17277.1 unnamed protein product [Fusarium langsethiae]